MSQGWGQRATEQLSSYTWPSQSPLSLHFPLASGTVVTELVVCFYFYFGELRIA